LKEKPERSLNVFALIIMAIIVDLLMNIVSRRIFNIRKSLPRLLSSMA